MRTLRERLLSRLIVDQRTGCLLWAGCVDDSGYGVIKVDGSNRKVHRVAWELEFGPVPEDMQLDHVQARGCHHRHCANVAHLEPVTQRENIMRGRGIAPMRAAQVRCVNDHPFDLLNTIVDDRGNRRCRACKRIRSREWMRRKRGSKALAS